METIILSPSRFDVNGEITKISGDKIYGEMENLFHPQTRNRRKMKGEFELPISSLSEKVKGEIKVGMKIIYNQKLGKFWFYIEKNWIN